MLREGEGEKEGEAVEGNKRNTYSAAAAGGGAEKREEEDEGGGDEGEEGTAEEKTNVDGREGTEGGGKAKRQRPAGSGDTKVSHGSGDGSGDVRQSSEEQVRAAQAAGLKTVKLGSNGISLLLLGQEEGHEGNEGERERESGTEEMGGSKDTTDGDGDKCRDVAAADAESNGDAHDKKDEAQVGGGSAAAVVGVVSRLLADMAAGKRKPLK